MPAKWYSEVPVEVLEAQTIIKMLLDCIPMFQKQTQTPIFKIWWRMPKVFHQNHDWVAALLSKETQEVVVAQLVERSISIPEVRGSTPVIGKILLNICLLSTVLKRRK